MYHFFISSGQISGNQIAIYGPDVNHIRNVLRLKPGETVLISDEAGTDYRCELSDVRSDGVTAVILEKKEENHKMLRSRKK